MTKHPWLRRLTIAFAIFVSLVVALVAFLFLFQPTLNLGPFKHLLEAQLTGLSGVPVTLEELSVKTSLRPEVEIRDLQVAELAGVERTQLQIELIPLLKQRISIKALRLDQVTVQVRPVLSSVKDWLGRDDRPKSPYRIDALENLELDRAQLNVTDDQGDSHRLVFDELDGGVSRTSPLDLKAHGSFDDVALQFKATGPTLEDLLGSAIAFPLAASLETAGARVSAEGTVTKQARMPALAFDFTLEGDDLQATLAAADVEVPSLGPFQFRGELSHSGGPIQLSSLEGQVGEVDLSGDLQLSLEDDRLALAGSLATSRIDLQPWLAAGSAEDDSDGGESEARERLFDRLLPVEPIGRALAALDLNLEVAVEGLEGLPTAVEELTGRLDLQDGRLTLPYGLRLAGASIQGQVEIASVQGLLELALDLSSSTLPLDRLAEDLGQGLATGSVGEVRLSASSSGTTVGGLLNRIAVELETGDAEIRFYSPDKDRHVDLVLTHMEMRRSVDVPMRIALDGELRGYPYRLDLTAQGTKDWKSKDPWPFKLTLEGLGAQTQAEGRLSIEPGDLFIDVHLGVTGDRLGDLEPWLGIPADVTSSYEVQGRLTVDPDQSALDLDTLRIGQTTATMNLLALRQESEPIRVDLAASSVALDELMQLIETEGDDLASEPVLTIDIPIWPEELSLPDTNAHFELERVLRNSEELADFSDVVADVLILQSYLERVTFSARADDAEYRGQLDLDWQTDPPKMNLDLGGEATDLGRLVSLEEVAPNLVVRAQRFDLHVTATEKTLRQMFLEGANISGTAEGIFLSAPSLDEEVPLEFTLNQAAISELPNQPFRLTADGHLWEWPIELLFTVHNRDRIHPDRTRLPTEMALRAGDVQLETKGELTLPLTPDNLDLSFSLTADRISSFEPFLGHRLSEVGPIAATGNLAIRPDSYALEDLSFEAGGSDVNGRASLDLTGARPKIAADLSSRRINLAELFASTLEPEEGEAESPDEPTGQEERTHWLERIESSPLTKVDLDIDLRSDDIYWGDEAGGGGQIRIQAEQGRFSAGPFSLALAGGNIEGSVDLLVHDGLVAADLELAVDNVDYGPIVRYFDPESPGQGRIDLETRLQSPSVPVDQLPTSVSGDFRFALYPHETDMTVLDLWGAGLLRSVFGVMDPTNESVVNCMVGDYQIAAGQMTAESFWFDTSRLRARGQGSIDLAEMSIDMTLRPRPKKRTFLSLATPARIKGPLKDPSISLTKGGLVGTAFRLYMWWWTVYLQVFRKPLPGDGSDICFLPPPPATAEVPAESGRWQP